MSIEMPKDMSDLIGVMAALRTPVTGCPWDLEQDFRSIAPYTLEEAYEVADAIERGDLPHLKEELGDLLLQVVYHSRLAEEQGAFAFGDVVDGITTKMIRRHPHVFGDQAARTAGAASDFWETAKAAERAAKAATQSATRSGDDAPSLLADVPVGLPGLTRAIKLQSKAARVGFDWPDIAPVFDKIREEIGELEAEMRGSPGHSGDKGAKGAIEDELGDMLFVMANLARHLEIDPEAALRRANEKFLRRFNHIERRLAEQGRGPAQSDLTEMDKFWDEAKALDKSRA